MGADSEVAALKASADPNFSIDASKKYAEVSTDRMHSGH